MSYKLISKFCLFAVSVLLIAQSCSPAAEKLQRSSSGGTVIDQLERPLPNPIEPVDEFTYAKMRDTRSEDGSPGDAYWQQYATYDMNLELNPKKKRLHGSVTIEYQNNSPNSLGLLYLELAMNAHQKDAVRIRNLDITKGMKIKSVIANGRELNEGRPGSPSWSVDNTVMFIRPHDRLESGGSVTLEIDWELDIPQRGASGRNGWDKDLFFLGYFYPHMRVHDDVYGWMMDPFKGNAEFYHGFADYTMNITMPADWVVMGTGEFLNPEEVLAPHVLERYIEAGNTTDIVHVIKKEDFGHKATAESENGMHTWRFTSEKVRDVAFSATRRSFWDATTAPVGDLNGDGETNYSRINAFWRELAPLWSEMADYAQHSVSFLSDFHQFPYPWPHMTAVEGSNIIGGGMEYPMMTLMGDYNTRGAMALYSVTAHEIAHMWFPMIVSTNERHFTWIDEGNTVFATDHARADYFNLDNPHRGTQNNYIGFAVTGREGEMMRRSDFHYTQQAYGVASYPKPASVLVALRGVLGEEVFWDAYHTIVQEWAWKHPYPYDLFNTFERVSGRDLSWFWRSWYYETWMLNHEVAGVAVDESEGVSVITIVDHEHAIMPVHLLITLEDGTEIREVISEEVWLTGVRETELTVPHTNIEKVEIDPEQHFPDIERNLNIWPR